MPIAERFFDLVNGLSLTDLLELATFLPILIRARIAGVHLTYSDVQHSSLSGLHRESDRTGRLQEVDPQNRPVPPDLFAPRPRNLQQRGLNSQQQPARSRSRSSYSSLDTEPEHRPGPNSVGGFRNRLMWMCLFVIFIAFSIHTATFFFYNELIG